MAKRYQYPAKTQPISTVPELVTEDRWHQPASTPQSVNVAFRAARYAVAIAAFPIDSEKIFFTPSPSSIPRCFSLSLFVCRIRVTISITHTFLLFLLRLCTRLGKGTHHYLYQIGDGKPTKSSVYCKD